MRRIPESGVYGEGPLREARAGELGEVVNLVERAFRAAYPQDYVYICAWYPERFIARRDGRLFAYPYSISEDNQVTFGTPTEVVLAHEPVALREALAKNSVGGGEGNGLGSSSAEPACFIEAVGDDSESAAKYLVRVIRAGQSGNGVIYPAAVLREAAPRFEGARVFVKEDLEHIAGRGKDVRQLVGRLVESRYVDGTGPGEIQAVLEVLQSSPVSGMLREAVQRKMTDLFGLSIDAIGGMKRSGRFVEAASITKVNSVDLIVEPGAGGQVIRFVEAQGPTQSAKDDSMLRDQMIHAIAKRDPKAAQSLANANDEEVLARYTEALAQGTLDQVDQRLATNAAQMHAVTALASSRLPQPARDRLQAKFREAQSLTIEQVDADIKAEAEYLGRFVEAGRVTGLGDMRVQPGEDSSDKFAKRLDDLFDGSKGAKGSFREAYVDFTGDKDVTGMLRNCDLGRMRELVPANFREAVSASTFSDILGDSITRAMMREYTSLEGYSDWRYLVDVVPIRDFRTNERTRMGGYGNLPAVAENGSYDPLTTPGDDKASYAITKRGGTETISLEAFANDDVGVLRRIPRKLAVAAARTLYEFVMDFLATNPTIYDGVALFHASHSNLGTTALSSTSFAAARLRMMKQTELTNAKRLGIILRHLTVPADLEETAYDLFVRTTNNDESFVQSRKPMIHVVRHWTDTNNWFASAAKEECPLIELGFFGGSEEPELFLQDNPTQGSLFSNDQLKFKIRHIYGGTVLDYRGLDGSIVA